jgi:hypothetical protein
LFVLNHYVFCRELFSETRCVDEQNGAKTKHQ